MILCVHWVFVLGLVMSKLVGFSLLVALCTSCLVVAKDESEGGSGKANMWGGGSRVSAGEPHTYTASMHNRFSDIKANYEENGKYYYSNATNSFGFQEVLNYEQEVVFCGSGDENFSDAVKIASQMPRSSDPSSTATLGDVRSDSTDFSMSPQNMDDAIKQVLVNNSNNNAKGRFCYKTSDSNVDYRHAGSELATFCSSGAELSYTDPVSGHSCTLELDIPLKEGETRFIRQLQTGFTTVAQGFIGCYSAGAGGEPSAILIDNPDGCSASDRSKCIRTCDWADDVVCDPRNMPRWGGGKCGAYGTVLFKGDVLNVDSSNAISYDSSTGTYYSGSAVMSCSLVSGKAQWTVVEQTCSAVE